MKNSLAVMIVGTLLVLGPAVQPAWSAQDEYDESQSHLLRVTAYAVHPFGRLLEWTVARPIHAIVSGSPDFEYLFGHKPHPPSLEQGAYEFGMSRPPAFRAASAEKAAPAERVVEKVVVKEVPVEKIVVKEVQKIVEVEKVVFSDIAFRFDSAELTDLGKGKAYLAAQKIKEKGDVVLVIEGHADYIGSDEYNRKLGLRRAETVKRELVGLGIDAARLSVESFGESKPLIDQQTGWARAANRRVEFKVKGQ